jgi:hypothetical protein
MFDVHYQLNMSMNKIRNIVLGLMTENLQSKHIFSHDEPENTHVLERTPDEYDMDYQSIYLQTPDGEFIHAYWIYQVVESETHLTMLYLHGAGGNISHRLEVLRLFYDNLNCNILIIDYRGLYGRCCSTIEYILSYCVRSLFLFYRCTRQLNRIRSKLWFTIGTWPVY